MKAFALNAVLLVLMQATPVPVSEFAWVQMKYEGNYDPYPTAYMDFLKLLEGRTSISPLYEKIFINPENDDIFSYPFLYWTGTSNFKPLSEKARLNIFKFVKFGGLLFVDNSGGENSGFIISARDELERIFGEGSIEEIPPEHVIFRTFFLFQINEARRFKLEGINIDGRFGVVIANSVMRRFQIYEEYFKLLLNIVMYAITTDYKTDKVHEPFIRRRLR